MVKYLMTNLVGVLLGKLLGLRLFRNVASLGHGPQVANLWPVHHKSSMGTFCVACTTDQGGGRQPRGRQGKQQKTKQQIRQETQDRKQKAGTQMGQGKRVGMTPGEGIGLIYGMPAKNVGPHCSDPSEASRWRQGQYQQLWRVTGKYYQNTAGLVR